MEELKHSKAAYSKVVASSIAGNFLEWFDFALYGYMAPYIGPHFFPLESKAASIISTFAVFSVGYIARPIGALVLGRLGDRVGRRTLLFLSIMILGLSSCLIGLLPSYQSIGLAAPVLLVLLRLAQGFSVGGEYTGSMTYTSEYSHRERRGLISSFSTTGTMLGILTASGTAWIALMAVGKEALADWGWRLPFLLGFVVAIFGAFLRKTIPETKEIHIQSKETADVGLWVSLKLYWRHILIIIGMVTGANVALYLGFFYVVEYHVTYGSHVQNLEIINTAGLALTIPTTVLGGWLSDRYGRKKISVIINAMILLVAIPSLYMLLDFNVLVPGVKVSPQMIFFIGLVLLAVPVGIVLGVQGAMVAEILPKHVRCTIFSVAYGLAMALFASTSPIVAQLLLGISTSPLLPGLYIVVWSVICLLSLKYCPETSGKEIN